MLPYSGIFEQNRTCFKLLIIHILFHYTKPTQLISICRDNFHIRQLQPASHVNKKCKTFAV